MNDLDVALQLEQRVLGEWVRALPCGCVMQVAEVFLEKGWFLTDSAITPCAEHPKKRAPRGMRVFFMQMNLGGDPIELLGPMEDKWFDGHGVLLEGAALGEARERAALAHEMGIVVGTTWRRWDGSKCS